MSEQKSLILTIAEWWEQRRKNGEPSNDAMQYPKKILRWLTPNGGTLILVLALIMTAGVWAKPLVTTTNAPGPSATTVNYQGRLADSEGVPLSGTYGMSFTIHDAETDGNIVWGPESHIAVTVDEGLFSVGLGSLTSGGIPTTVWNGDRYLEISVNDQTMTPRELIRSVPIAGMALTVPDGAITGDKLSSAFGSSGQPILNFIPRVASSDDLDISTEVGNWTEWDLSPIVGNSATAVVVYARVAGSESGSFVSLRGGGSTHRVVMASALNSGKYKGYSELTIPCGPNQIIEYRVDGDGGSSVGAQFNITGWYEPVNTP